MIKENALKLQRFYIEPVQIKDHNESARFKMKFNKKRVYNISRGYPLTPRCGGLCCGSTPVTERSRSTPTDLKKARTSDSE